MDVKVRESSSLLVPASMENIYFAYILALVINAGGFVHNIKLILEFRRNLFVGLIIGMVMSVGTAELLRYCAIILCGGKYVP